MSTYGMINGMKYTSLLPPKSLFPARSIPIRKIIPLEKPPTDNITFPPVPTIRTDPGLTSTYPPFTFYTASSLNEAKYKLTTHLYPSAYPRSPYRFGSTPVDITEHARIAKEEKKDVREKMFTEYMGVLDQWASCVNRGLEGGCESLENYESVCATQKRVMWNSVNRIVRVDSESDPNRKRLTLFFAHANGFPKETWEPTINSLLSQLEKLSPQFSENDSPDNTPIIEEIWVFEAVQHGDTGLINAGLLPRAYDWLDNVRDILQFLLYYIPDRVERASNGELPTHLTRLPEPTATLRKKEGFSSRTIVGIGHSFGGCSVTWNSDVLNAYIEHGIVEEDGVAKLKMSGLHETILFLHRQATFETWELLPQINNLIPMFWVVSGLDGVALGGLEVLPETVWRRHENSSNVVLPVGHLIPHEAPIELASLLRRFLIDKHSTRVGSKSKSALGKGTGTSPNCQCASTGGGPQRDPSEEKLKSKL